MNVIFAGTSPFAVASLERLIASAHDVLAVITQPDKPRGRGRGMQITPVKEVALAHGIPVLQPEKISAPESVAQIKSYGPIGAMVVVAYGQKISSELLEWPEHGVVNVHGSILPKYRGAAPIQQAVIEGETQTGVTTMLMAEGWDTGDILLQKNIDIPPDENAGELSQRLAVIGGDLLIETLNGLEEGLISPIPQDDELATMARSLRRDAGVIDWRRGAAEIVNLIRGCTPKPGAFTKLHSAMIKVWNAAIEESDGAQGEPGSVVKADKDAVVIAAGNGSVRLIDVQAESRQRMSAADFTRGAKLRPGDMFEVWFKMAD
ncbi:MAG: methionyl-tRNA formyltransferase [Armatimonadota bacterium]|nr:methionyl-tRNA formyltransferase [bacterium]